ncbi:hypothetical protein EXIGLDRAFT_357957 [Exidia glandulosa HHB12029]|uniref:F-box domain-containing protein n=1 Tax=Exidia glandulosa HHB12029 TaxID=1314781 RepID=A0A165LBB0_EXIGL|nr:hypothetical protein EXIGLDRAFT_357957 [Exidia glandulosa HHB12029]
MPKGKCVLGGRRAVIIGPQTRRTDFRHRHRRAISLQEGRATCGRQTRQCRARQGRQTFAQRIDKAVRACFLDESTPPTMLLSTEIDEFQSVVSSLVDRAAARAGAENCDDDLIVAACSEVAAAAHKAISVALRTRNSRLPIHTLPFEVLGEILCHATTNEDDACSPIVQAVRASLVCRYWRDVALKTPRLWSRVDVDDRDVPPERLDAMLQRSGGLPISIRSTGSAFCDVLPKHLHRIRHLSIPHPVPPSPVELELLLKGPAPNLETLWIPGCVQLPANLLGDVAPRLTTLAIGPTTALCLDFDYPALANLTTVHIVHPNRAHVVPFELDQVEHLLRQCPRLKTLTGITAVREGAVLAAVSNQLETVHLYHNFFLDLRAPPVLELLDHKNIKTITLSSVRHPSVIHAAEGLKNIVDMTVDVTGGCMRLVDERGFVRVFDEWKSMDAQHRLRETAFDSFVMAPGIAWTLRNLTLVGELASWTPTSFPPLHAVETLTIGLNPTARRHLLAYASATASRCSNLRELRLAATSGVVTLPLITVETFLRKALGAKKVERLHFDSVRVQSSGASAWRPAMSAFAAETIESDELLPRARAD